jgi:hypothetical protein
LGEDHCHKASAAQTNQTHYANIEGLCLRVDHEKGIDQQNGDDNKENNYDVEDQANKQNGLVENRHAT